jgi:hypothetical protein
MTRKRSTHQAPEWTPTQTWAFLFAMLALACALSFAFYRVLLAVLA